MAKVDLTHELVADIKQKAKAAEELAPGTWHGGPDGDHWVLVDSQRGVFHTTCKERNIAEFIAYADPATVLAMVEEIERFRHFVRETLDELHECYNEESCKICKEIDRVIESEAGQ